MSANPKLANTARVRRRAGNSLIWFPSESLVFCPKMSEWAIHSKKCLIHSFALFLWATWAIRSWSLISSERCEQIAHGRSFFVSDLSDSLTWLRGNERSWANHSGRSPKKRKWANRSVMLICLERPERFAHGFISSERPERFAHGSSFVLSDLSKSLTVAHLIWANEQMSDEQMSEFPVLTARSWTLRRLTLLGVDNLIFRRTKSD